MASLIRLCGMLLFPFIRNYNPDRKSSSLKFTGHNCIVCMEPIRGREICAPCGHYYDEACISDLFRASIQDQSLYPPRCCRRPIPFKTVRPLLTHDLATVFTEKLCEFNTLKRVYCASPSCNRFLGPRRGRWRARVISCPVPECRTRTCTGCASKAEPGAPHACRVSETDREALALSRSAGWTRCPGCTQMVERRSGCDHMVCRCKTQFCYRCGGKWWKWMGPMGCWCKHRNWRRLVATGVQPDDDRAAQLRRVPIEQRIPTLI